MNASFVATQSNQLKSDPPKRKGERTRETIKLATAKVLEKIGYHEMRVADIMHEAGLTHGSFYVYFEDKSDATHAVLSEFIDFLSDMGGDTIGQSAFDSIRISNKKFIEMTRTNAGLMRCMLQLGDEDPAFSKIVQKLNHGWYDRVTKSVLRHYPKGKASKDVVHFAVYSLGAMMDELVRRLVVYPDPKFVRLVERIAPGDRELADALSVMWYRILYPGNPVPSGLKGIARKLEKLAEVEISG